MKKILIVLTVIALASLWTQPVSAGKKKKPSKVDYKKVRFSSQAKRAKNSSGDVETVVTVSGRNGNKTEASGITGKLIAIFKVAGDKPLYCAESCDLAEGDGELGVATEEEMPTENANGEEEKKNPAKKKKKAPKKKKAAKPPKMTIDVAARKKWATKVTISDVPGKKKFQDFIVIMRGGGKIIYTKCSSNRWKSMVDDLSMMRPNQTFDAKGDIAE